MSPLTYELGFYIPEYDFHHSHSRKNLKSYIGNLDTNNSCGGLIYLIRVH
jgi:hypothetical protein